MRRLYFICIHTFVLLVGMHMLCSCQRDEDLFPTLPTEHEELVITVQSEKMLPKVVTTRVSDTKNEEETKINHLYVFFLGQDGNFLADVIRTVDGYKYTDFSAFVDTRESTITLNLDAIKEVDKDQPVQMYILANMDGYDLFEKDATTGRPILQGTSHLQALQDKIIQIADLQALQMAIPQGGMPMAMLQEVNFRDPNLSNNVTVSLEALMARIDFNIKLSSDYAGLGDLPMFYLDYFTIGNAPKGGLLGATATTPTDIAALGGTETVEVRNQKLIYNKRGEITFTFYMFENLQEAKTPTAGTIYQENQQFKPVIAPDNATYVDLNGIYTTYDGHDYNITYRLYLGANHTDNFEIKRNYQYKNDITIKGLTKANHIEGEDYFTLDTRVDIHESNKFYISILNEKALDAHFGVLPMDVYFLGQNNGKIIVTLGDDTNTCYYDSDGDGDVESAPEPWIRMEKMPAANMQAGTLPNGYTNHVTKEGKFKAYHGIRKFFTEDLVTNTLKNSHTLTIDATRDRIYFYIDENLGDDERVGTVTLKYYDNGQTSGTPDRTEVFTIRQLPLVKVDVGNKHGDCPGQYKTIWMEQIEEYLDSYDPLEEYDSNNIFQGLPWGFSGTTIGNLRNYGNSYQNYYYGVEYTAYLIEKYAANNGDIIPMDELYLSKKPEIAAQYCYNRNKRSTDNKVNPSVKITTSSSFLGTTTTISNYTAKWFMPAVRQMEVAQESHYSTFKEFQGNFYWSSSSGYNSGLFGGENTSRARAVQVTATGEHIESSNNNPGAKERTDNTVRLRAFRMDRKKR